jgi:hypothetical protein
MLIDCRKNLNQRDITDYKIITIEGGKKVFLVGFPDHCQYFKIQ